MKSRHNNNNFIRIIKECLTTNEQLIVDNVTEQLIINYVNYFDQQIILTICRKISDKLIIYTTSSQLVTCKIIYKDMIYYYIYLIILNFVAGQREKYYLLRSLSHYNFFLSHPKKLRFGMIIIPIPYRELDSPVPVGEEMGTRNKKQGWGR